MTAHSPFYRGAVVVVVVVFLYGGRLNANVNK